ncbi:MAG TPA: ABC transporter permease subunit [Spirillospora sp.]|nr:ABC transporter permease subunit [Spirillospora sp.]
MRSHPRLVTTRVLLPAALIVLAIAVNLALLTRITALEIDNPLLVDSTLGELAVWLAAQSEQEAPQSMLGQLARAQAVRAGAASLDTAALLTLMQRIMVGILAVSVALAAAAVVGLFANSARGRTALIGSLIVTLLPLFILPVGTGDNTLMLVMAACVLLITAYFAAPGRITRFHSFVAVLAIIFLVWEGSKAVAAALDYRVAVPATNWEYTGYPTLDDALVALEAGEIDAVIADRSAVRDLMAPFPLAAESEPESFAYPNLRYLTNINTGEAVLGIFPVTPAFPGRLAVVVTAAGGGLSDLNSLLNKRIGTPTGEFADERYLSAPREVILLDLRILNDLNLPHLQNIAEALLQPARRNGPLLLARILADAALHTWGEAVLGFGIGGLLGFLLGTLFAHFAPVERGLLPYVVASQTVPILAIAPMVVIWLGAGPQAVAVISAYLTFFPVTINTLRGLRSPHPNAIELMRSYAASRREVMWKLRFPAALPYIFTALKVSATASVVGAIIGELPSSIRSGLGRAILDFSSDYSLVSTPKLWAAILAAASIGILSFLIVGLVEYLVLRHYIRN